MYLILSLAGFLCAYGTLAYRQKILGCAPADKRRTRGAFLLALAGGYGCAYMSGWVLGVEGFSFYYGMLAFFAVSALLLWLLKLDAPFWLNEIVPSVLIAHAFGRIGCSFAGCCYGRPVALLGRAFLFPARELEALGLFVLFFIFVTKIKRRRVFWYLLCYSVLRFFLEFGRGDDRGVLLVRWLSPAQMTSVIVWAGLGVQLIVRRAKKRRSPIPPISAPP